MENFKELCDWAKSFDRKPTAVLSNDPDAPTFATVLVDTFNINICGFTSNKSNDMIEIRFRYRDMESTELTRYRESIILFSFNLTEETLFITSISPGWSTEDNTKCGLDTEIEGFNRGGIPELVWKKIYPWLLSFEGGI